MNTQHNTITRSRLYHALADAGGKARHKFNQLSPRDRLALSSLTSFVALLILIYGMILPVISFHDNARKNFQDQQALLDWLNQQQPAIQTLASKAAATAPTTTAAGNPLTLVNNTAKDFALKITRLQPENNGNLRVWMEEVSFDNTLRWLHHLQAKGLAVKEITVDQQQEGIVSVRVVF